MLAPRSVVSASVSLIRNRYDWSPERSEEKEEHIDLKEVLSGMVALNLSWLRAITRLGIGENPLGFFRLKSVGL